MRKIKIMSIVLGIVFLAMAVLSAMDKDVKGVLLNVMVCGIWISLARVIDAKIV